MQLGRGQPHPLHAGGGHQFGHGLGLRQIDTTVQKGPAGKLAPFGLARPVGQHGFQHGLEHGRPAVALDFGRILAGKGVGTGKKDRQGVVQVRSVGVHDATVVQGAGDKTGETGRGRPKNGLQHGARAGPDSRTTPMAPAPGAVATAAMVSAVPVGKSESVAALGT